MRRKFVVGGLVLALTVSALALAGSFREHGVIGRGQLAKAAAWQLLFAARGAGAETVRKAAEDGLMILKGFRVDELRTLVAGAMEPVLKPLVYREPLDLVEQRQRRRVVRRLHRPGLAGLASVAPQAVADDLAVALGHSRSRRQPLGQVPQQRFAVPAEGRPVQRHQHGDADQQDRGVPPAGLLQRRPEGPDRLRREGAAPRLPRDRFGHRQLTRTGDRSPWLVPLSRTAT